MPRPDPADPADSHVTLRVVHACCTRPAEWPPGARVLAMRKPRGLWIKAVRDAGGEWLPEAGPSTALLAAYRAGEVDWPTFAARYRQEMLAERPAVLDQLLARAAADPARTVVVLCWERLDGTHPHCHRTILAELLIERARAQGHAATAAPVSQEPIKVQGGAWPARPPSTGATAGTFRHPGAIYASMPLPPAGGPGPGAPPPAGEPGSGGPPPAAGPPAAECPACGGAGYLRQEVPVGHPDFGALVSCECRKRAERQHDQEELYRVSNLGAYRRCTFATFHPLPDVAAALAAAQEFAAGLEGWLILCGRFGCGKTHLAASIANVALSQGTMTYFAVVPDLLDHLRSTFAPTSEVSYDERFEQVREAELLILDDLGTENVTPWVREKLYQIINYRWIARRPTVVTTNVPFNQMDPRIVSRLRDQDLCRVLTIEARDYRQRDNPDLK